MLRLGISFIVALLLFASGAHAQENILVLVADNVGPDLIGAYGEGSNPATTPNLDALAANGVLFRNTLSNPYGGPTRATLLTGRYGFRTDVGGLKPPNPPYPHFTLLDARAITLPEMLQQAGAGYRSAALGKWTLGSLPQGFEYYAGMPDYLGNYTYFDKTRYFADGSSDQVLVTCDASNTDPVVAQHSAGRAEPCYETTNLVDEAILKIQEFGNAGSPWLVWVAFHAANSKLHMPPADLLPSGRRYRSSKDSEKVRAMIEAMDTEIGRLLAALPPNTTVVFVSDKSGADQIGNCTPTLGSCTRVPLIVGRPGSIPGERSVLVNTTDLFATVAEIAGVTSSAEDSVSLLPYLAAPTVPTLPRPSIGQPYAYAEYFDFDAKSFGRAIRDDRYKYVWTSSDAAGMAEALYDLAIDPQESTNLLDLNGDGLPNPPQAGAEQAAYAALTRAIFENLHDPDRDLIPYQQDTCPNVANRLRASCDTDGDSIGNACDCDFDNDGICGFSDYSILLTNLDLKPPADLSPDMNCDGVVDLADFSIWEPMFGQPPGPSGLYCADPTQPFGACEAPPIPASGVNVRPNILVLIADDVGTDLVHLYEEFDPNDPNSPTIPVTPNIDTLAHTADRGSVYFRDAYAAPVCAPTRAMLLTGRYGFRTGVGYLGQDLRPSEVTLAEMLGSAYHSAALGKWHLLGGLDFREGLAFDRTGFEYYGGYPQNLDSKSANYTHPVPKVRIEIGANGAVDYQTFFMTCASPLDPNDPNDPNDSRDEFVAKRLGQGATGLCSNDSNPITGTCISENDCGGGLNYCRNQACYDTTNIVDEAIARVDAYGAEPWLIWVGFHAIHSPLPLPPADLVSSEPTDASSPEELLQALMEATDTEIGRLVDYVLANAPNTTVFFIGDNGTAGGGCKGKIDECGVRVPFIVSSPDTPPGPSHENPTLTGATDLFATVAAIAGIQAQAEDSENLLSHITALDPVTPYRRSVAGPYIYSESFLDLAGPGSSPRRTIRNDRFKYSWSYIGELRRTKPGAPPDYVWTLEETFIDLEAPSVDLLLDSIDDDNETPDVQESPETLRSFALLRSAMHDTLHDSDGDGVDYQTDTCTLVRNSPDYDDDADGVGNLCDCDFDNDWFCTQDDLADLRALLDSEVVHNSSVPEEQFLAQFDMDGYGTIDSADEALVIARLGQPTGPSGLDCANPLDYGTVVCEPAPRPSNCRDGVFDVAGEYCDVVGGSAVFGGLECADFGCTGGDLICTATCSVSFASCTGCPVCDYDGFCEEGEDDLSCPTDCIAAPEPEPCHGPKCGRK